MQQRVFVSACAELYSMCFLVSSAVSINEFKNREVIDGLGKRSDYKGMVGLHWKKTVSPLNVSAADIRINHCN